MALSTDELLSLRMGRATVRENLERGVKAGRLIRRDDGLLELRQSTAPGDWIRFENAPHPACKFLHDVVFQIAYDRAAVPFGCRDCYKVKVSPQSLRELAAAKDLAASVACRSKWGPEVDIPYSQSRYGGFFYTLGLSRARSIYKAFRAVLDTAIEGGSKISMFIKRGCSDYEVHCGPSNQWTFAPELEALETAIAAQLHLPAEHVPQTREQVHGVSVNWLYAAHRMGDRTYLDFTGGQPVYPAPVRFDPDGE